MCWCCRRCCICCCNGSVSEIYFQRRDGLNSVAQIFVSHFWRIPRERGSRDNLCHCLIGQLNNLYFSRHWWSNNFNFVHCRLNYYYCALSKILTPCVFESWLTAFEPSFNEHMKLAHFYKPDRKIISFFISLLITVEHILFVKSSCIRLKIHQTLNSEHSLLSILFYFFFLSIFGEHRRRELEKYAFFGMLSTLGRWNMSGTGYYFYE